MGDLNFNFFNKRDAALKSLSYVMATFGLSQIITQATRNDTLLDHCWVSDSQNFIQNEVFEFSGSDHNLLICVRKNKFVKMPTKIIFYNDLAKPGVKEKLNEEFNNVDWTHLKLLSHPKHMITYFQNRAQRIVNEVCPTKK